MNTEKFIWNFHIFDGDGGEGGEGSEASSFLESLGGNTKSSGKTEVKSDSRVEYGKSSDVAEEVESASTEETPDAAAEFESLIGKGGKYHEAYGQMVQSAIQSRFKNQSNLQEQVDAYGELFAPLAKKYGIDATDTEGLKNAIANDDALYVDGAEREGLSVDQYKDKLRLEAEAERGRQIQQAYEQQKIENERFSQWETESTDVQAAFPNFDLMSELDNERFAQLLHNGVGVMDAFVTTHMDEIMAGMQESNSRQATRNVVEAIQQRASRPVESGVKHSAAVVRKTDPSTLTNDDIDEILKRTEAGETFSW